MNSVLTTESHMPRIQVRPREVDKTFAIEEAIARVLDQESIARLSTTSIETEYDLLDENGEIVNASFDAKCEYLAKKFGVSFEIKGDDVWLRREPKRTAK